MSREMKLLNDEEIRRALKERGIPDDEIPKLSSKMERFIEKELINRSSDSDFRSKFIKNPRSSFRKTRSKPISNRIDRLFAPLPFVRPPSKRDRIVIDKDLSITRQKVLQDVPKSPKVEIGRVTNPTETAARLNKISLANITKVLPIFEKIRANTEALKNNLNLIPIITQQIGDTTTFKPAYNFAFEDPEESYYIEDWGDIIEEDDVFFDDHHWGHVGACGCDYNGWICVTASLTPWDPQNHHLTDPTDLEATAEVGIEFTAWKNGRLQAVARIPDFLYDAARNWEGLQGLDQTDVKLWLKACCYKLGPNDEILESTWDGRFLCPGVTNGTSVFANYHDTNIIFPNPDYGVMNLQAGDRVKIIISLYAYVYTACMPCYVSAHAMGHVSVISASIKDD